MNNTKFYLRGIAIVLMLCCCALNLSAQQQKFSIKGKLVDKNTKEAMMFANCVLHYDTDTIGIYKGESANDKGEFSFKGVKPRRLIFKASFVGYDVYRRVIEVSDFQGNGVIDLGVLEMTSASNLGEIQVVSERKRIEIDEDKMTMNIDEGMAAASESAFDLLKKVPGVFIDSDENITLNGQSGVAFWYNGREMKMEWEAIVDFLKGITPEQVDKFEVLTNPGVKYDAEGTGGIINLRLKQSRNYGINGNVGANISHRTDWSGGLNGRLNYVDDKWIASFGYSYHNMNFNMNDSSQTYRWVGSDTTLFRRQSNMVHKGNNHNLDFSASYSIDTTSTIGFSSNLSLGSNPWNETNNPTYISSNPNYFDADSMYQTLSGSERKRNSLMAGVSYVKKLDSKETKISSDLDFTHSWNDSKSKDATQYYLGYYPKEEYLYNEQSYKRTTNTTTNNISWRVDYYKPLGKGKKFEAGFKTNLSSSDKDYNSLEWDYAQQRYFDNGFESNDFKYTENINSLYASYSGNLTQKLNARFGLRLEQTNTKGELVTLDSTITRHYFNIFPNIRLNYKFAMDNQLSLTYSYRISRPWSESLNPFVSKQNEYSYRTGNALLEPQYSHSILISHSWKYMLFTDFRWSYTNNNIDWLSESLDSLGYTFPYNPLALISHPVNFGTSQNAALNVSFNKEFFDFWQVNAEIGGRWDKIMSSANMTQELNRDNWSYHIRLNSDFTLPGKTRLGFFYMFMSSSIRGASKDNGWQHLDCHVNRSFFNEKVSLSLSAGWDLGRKSYDESIYGSYISKHWRNDHQIDVRFSIRYMFGKMYRNKQVQKIQTEDFDDRAGAAE